MLCLWARWRLRTERHVPGDGAQGKPGDRKRDTGPAAVRSRCSEMAVELGATGRWCQPALLRGRGRKWGDELVQGTAEASLCRLVPFRVLEL